MGTDKKITFGQEVADSLENNAYFKEGGEYSGPIELKVKELLDAKAKQLSAAKKAQSLLEKERQVGEELDELLLRTAHFVEDASDGDVVKIESAGFSVYYPGRSGPVGLLGAPTGVLAETGSKEGVVEVHWNPQLKAKSFVVQYASEAAGPNGWVTYGTNPTRSSLTVTGLNSLERYRFRVAAVSSAGTSAWSDAASGVAF